jgi:hypothetical protein
MTSHRFLGDDGMSTAEYAIGTLAAAGLAGILLAVLTGGQVVDLITDLVKDAFSVSF